MEKGSTIMFDYNINLENFSDVSSKTQIKNGTTCLKDLKNPGRYYIETKSGLVYVINKHNLIIDNTTIKYVNRHCINSRVKRYGHVKITDKLMRIARINDHHKKTKGQLSI